MLSLSKDRPELHSMERRNRRKKKDEEQERAAFSLKDTEIKPFFLEEIKNPLFKQ